MATTTRRASAALSSAFRMQHAVKFMCTDLGSSQSATCSPLGSYQTAGNAHNPLGRLFNQRTIIAAADSAASQA